METEHTMRRVVKRRDGCKHRDLTQGTRSPKCIHHTEHIYFPEMKWFLKLGKWLSSISPHPLSALRNGRTWMVCKQRLLWAEAAHSEGLLPTQWNAMQNRVSRGCRRTILESTLKNASKAAVIKETFVLHCPFNRMPCPQPRRKRGSWKPYFQCKIQRIYKITVKYFRLSTDTSTTTQQTLFPSNSTAHLPFGT